MFYPYYQLRKLRDLVLAPLFVFFLLVPSLFCSEIPSWLLCMGLGGLRRARDRFVVLRCSVVSRPV
jgi:hypothetical protein